MSHAQLLLLRQTYDTYERSNLERKIEFAKEMNIDHDVARKWYNFHRWKKRNLTKEPLSVADITKNIQRKYENFTSYTMIGVNCVRCVHMYAHRVSVFNLYVQHT